MKRCVLNILIGLTCLLPTVIRADELKAPTTVNELWADFDPRKDELDTKVVREGEKNCIVYRYVTYHIGTFKGKPARMAVVGQFVEVGIHCKCTGFGRLSERDDQQPGTVAATTFIR